MKRVSALPPGLTQGLSASGWPTEDSIRVTSIGGRQGWSTKWKRLTQKYTSDGMASPHMGGWSGEGCEGPSPHQRQQGTMPGGMDHWVAQVAQVVNVIFVIVPS